MAKEAEEMKLKEVQKRNKSYVNNLFKTLVFMCEKKWAKQNFDDVIRFLGRTCDPEIQQVLDDSSVTYLSSTSVSELISVLSDYIEHKVLGSLRSEKFTLLADESTETTNRTQLSIFVRWVSKLGIVEEYLGLIHVTNTTSLALMEAITTFFIAKNIDLSNVRFVGLDGCNTMKGEQKGKC